MQQYRVFINSHHKSLDYKLIILKHSSLEIYHYLRNVIKVRKKEIIIFFDNNFDYFYECKDLNYNYIEFIFIKKENKIEYFKNIALAIPYIKQDKMMTMIQQVVQFNVKEFFLIKTEFSSLKNIDCNKIDSNIIQSLEQSNGNILPIYKKYKTISAFIENQNEEKPIFLLADKNGEKDFTLIKRKISELDSSVKKIGIVGPEGGFSKEEEEIFNNLENCIKLKFSDRILRSEVASSAMMAALNFLD